MRASGKPLLTLVGGGRVGATLGHQLRRRGYPIQTVACRTEESARRSASFIGEGAAVSLTAGDVRPTELVLLCVPDDGIAGVAERLAEQGDDWSRSVVLHCSGRLSSGALAPLRAQGARVGSMHPLQAFAAPTRAVGHLEGTYFCVEGDPQALTAARRLVLDLGGHPFAVSSEAKPLYHAAAALASNGLVACFALAIHLLMEAGLDGGAARRALLPLMRGTAKNLDESGPKGALTGPVARGDEETVADHLRALGELPDRVVEDAYRALSLVLVDLAQDGERIGPVVATRLRKLLSTGSVEGEEPG